MPALAHRLMVRPELWVQRLRAEDVVAEALETVPTPPAEDALRAAKRDRLHLVAPAGLRRSRGGRARRGPRARPGRAGRARCSFPARARRGRRPAREPQVSVRLSLDRDRALEGDEVTATHRAVLGRRRRPARAARPAAARAERRGRARAGDPPACRRGADGRAEAAVRALGRVHGRAAALPRARRARPSLVGGQRAASRSRCGSIPSEETLRSLVPPLETQVFAGNQVSRVRGEGIEFADLREWQPGDRLRRVNWRATALRGALWVNEQNPERNTDVVLFLDTFAEVRAEGREHERPGGARRGDARPRLPAAERPRRARRLRRLPVLARAGVGDAAALRHRRHAADEPDRAQLRPARRRRAAAADAAPEGARAGDHAAARQPHGRRAARPARARLRPDRRRGVPARAGRAGAAARRSSSRTSVAALARGAALAVRAGRRARRDLARRRSARRPARGGDAFRHLARPA